MTDFTHPASKLSTKLSPKLSIVTTLYSSEPYLQAFYERITRAAQAITPEYELILVNDGCPQGSLAVAQRLFAQDPKVSVVDLSRNFGHFKAIMTGLSYAQGDFVFLIDCDLEEDPALLQDFWAAMTQENQGSFPSVDVIYGIQASRKGGWWEQWTGALYYKICNFMRDTKVSENWLTIRLMSRRYVQNLLQYKEHELEIATVMAMVGFIQKPFIVQKGHKSETSYTFSKKFNILVNAITSASSKPLWGVFYIGVIITILAVMLTLWLIWERLVSHTTVEGWTSVMVTVCFFNGLTVLMLGVIGVYLSKIFIEIKARPYTIVRQHLTHSRPLADIHDASLLQYTGK